MPTMKTIAPLLLAVVTASVATTSSVRAAIQGWAVVKGQSFWQEPGQDPQPESPEGWFAAAGLWADPITAATLTGVTLERSGGDSPLVLEADSGAFWLQDDAEWDTKAEMDADAPNNFTYKLRWTSLGTGSKSSTLGPLGADNYPSAAPRISNLAALQSLAPGQAFTIQWDAMPNGTANDWIKVEVWGGSSFTDWLVAESPWIGQSGALNGQATSFTVADGLPSTAGTYEVIVTFVKVVRRDTTTQAGAVGIAGFAKGTEAELRASAGNCAYTLSGTSANVGSMYGQGSFTVTTTADCEWHPTSSQDWLFADGFGPGSGAVTFYAGPNTNASFRTGTLTIGNQTFTVTQGPAGYDWHQVFGWIYSAGSDWYFSNAYGWMWFHPAGQWIYSTSLNGWLASTDPHSRTLWTPQFGWLTPSATDTYQAETAAIGTIYVGKFNGATITDGWVISPRFGYVWAAGDGMWFYSDTHGWLGVTSGGGIWSVNEGRFL
jgi:hypothetical protein